MRCKRPRLFMYVCSPECNRKTLRSED